MEKKNKLTPERREEIYLSIAENTTEGIQSKIEFSTKYWEEGTLEEMYLILKERGHDVIIEGESVIVKNC